MTVDYTLAIPLRYWFFVLGLVLLTIFISYGTYATAKLLQHWRPRNNVLLQPGENLVRLAIIALCVGLGKLSGLGHEVLGWQFGNLAEQWGWGLAIGLTLGLFFYYSTRWVMAHSGQRLYSTIVIEHIAPANRRDLILVFLAMLPIVLLEELLFRSLLLGGLSPLIPIPALLIILSVLFGILHSPQGLWGMIGAGLAGFLFGLLFLWQSSLLTPVIAHYITNTFQLIQAKRFYGKLR